MADLNCNTHPEHKAEAVCIRCGAGMCAECLRLGDLCPKCRVATNDSDAFIWTKEGQRAVFGILWSSWRNIAFHPVKTGNIIGAYPKLGRAWLFAAVTLGITVLANLIFALFNQAQPVLSGDASAVGGLAVSIASFIGSTVGVNLFTVLLLMFILSLGQLVIGNRPNFRLTLAVMLYAQVASLLGLLPCIGGLLVPIGTVLVAGMLLKGMSGETAGRAYIAVLLPVVMLLGCLAIAFYVIWQEIGPTVTNALKALSLVYYQPS
jgi:hypothetical protein